MPIRVIPVVLGQPRANGTNDFAGRPPVTYVHIAPDPRNNSLPTHNGKSYAALIDTGGEDIAIDSAAAQEIGAQAEYPATVHVMGKSLQTRGIDIQIIFPSCGLVYRARAAILDFRGAGNKWDLLLGRSFLQKCRLRLDGPKGLYQLEWIDQPSDIDPTK